MKVLDCHQHVSLKPLLQAENAAVLEEKLLADVKDRRHLMDRCSIESTMLLPSFDYDKSEGIASVRAALEMLQRYQAVDPVAFRWIGCSVEPGHHLRAGEQLASMIASGKYSAVTWHNRFHGIAVDSPIMFELVEVAAAKDTPIFLHVAGNLDHEEAWRAARLVRGNPGARFVVLDSLMTLVSFEIMTELGANVENLWIDVANTLPVRRLIESAGQRMGWDRILFGSCFYSEAHSFTKCSPLEEFLAVSPSEDISERVLRRNLEVVLGIQRDPSRPCSE